MLRSKSRSTFPPSAHNLSDWDKEVHHNLRERIEAGVERPSLRSPPRSSFASASLHVRIGEDSPGPSLNATSDAVGNWAYVTQYKPFGQEYATSGSYASLKYTGQWRDANTGLYYLYRRFYDPDLGRFLSPDPILGHLTVPQSLDRYLYTVNNPLRYVDQTGEDWWNPFEV